MRLRLPHSSLAAPPWGAAIVPCITVAYVIAAAVGVDRGHSPFAWWLGLAAAIVVLVSVRSPSVLARGAGWGMAVVVASVGARAGVSRALDACGGVGVLACALAASVAIARVPVADGALVRAEPVAPTPSLVALGGAWWAAVASAVTPRRIAWSWMAAHAHAVGWVALLVTAGILYASVERTLHRCRLDLAVVERMRAARRVFAVDAAVFGFVFAFAEGPSRSAIARFAVALAACGVVVVARHDDAVRVTRVVRRLVVTTVVGGSVALIGVSAVDGRLGDPWLVTLTTAVACLATTWIADRLEAPFRPASGLWLEAFASACDKSLHADPREALRAALFALRDPLGPGSASPELWTVAPERAMAIDAAGYVHERTACLPHEIATLAAAEPGGTLRREVLEAVEVRRPDLRPVVSWLRDRDALTATVVACDGELEGVLVLPRGPRRDFVTLEEVRAVALVADRMALACRASGTELRLLAREHEATQRADRATRDVQRLEHRVALEEGRRVTAVGRLARSAEVGAYGAALRDALEAIERHTQLGVPLVVSAPGGVDPVPYLARTHLAGPRAHQPLVVVDGTSAREHERDRWNDPVESPLALAGSGMLVLLDGAALPFEIQAIVAHSMATTRVPWGADRFDVQLALTTTGDPRDLVATGRLEPALEARLGEALGAAVALPRLATRFDDFRAVLTDRLAREGLRRRGRPIGIEPAAFARLASYAFPGDEAELLVIVQRLVDACRGDVVVVADLDPFRLSAEPFEPLETTQASGDRSKRRSRRPESSRRKDPLSA